MVDGLESLISLMIIRQLASVSITGNQVARFLDALEEVRGLPKSIVCDNGT